MYPVSSQNTLKETLFVKIITKDNHLSSGLIDRVCKRVFLGLFYNGKPKILFRKHRYVTGLQVLMNS
jgi:hypothetical protein